MTMIEHPFFVTPRPGAGFGVSEFRSTFDASRELYLQAFASALIFASRDAARGGLCAVEIESNGDGLIFLTSTNGHTAQTLAIKHHDGSGQDAPHGRCTVTRDSVAEYVKSKGYAPLVDGDAGDFPDARRVFGAQIHSDGPGQIGLDAGYLATLAQSLKKLKAGRLHVRMVPGSSALDVVRFTAGSVFHKEASIAPLWVVMPVRLD